MQCTIGSLNKSLNFLFAHVIPKSLAKTGRGNIWSKIKEQNPPRLSDGSVIAAPADGAVTLSRLPFQTGGAGEEGAGSEPHNGCDGHRMSVLMARPADSPGGDTLPVNGHWKLRPVAWGFRRCTELHPAFDSEIILSALLKSGPESSCALRDREVNSSFCLNHYRRYLCEIDTIRAEITNRFLKWVLCPYIFANFTIKMFSVYSSPQVL